MTQRTLSLPISGMHFTGCEAVIATAVKELPGVETVSADHRANKVKVRFDDALVSSSTILACIENKGDSYGVMDEKVSWLPRLKQVAVFLVLLALVVELPYGARACAWIDETIRCQTWLWRNLYGGTKHLVFENLCTFFEVL